MGSKRFSAWGDLGMMAAISLGSMLVVSVFMEVAMAITGNMEVKGPLLFVVYTAQFALSTAFGAVWLWRRGGVRLRFGIKWSDATMILWGVVLVTAASLILEPLIALFPAHYLEELNESLGRGGWTILTTVVAAPVLEEIFFRGMLLEQLSRRWHSTVAVLVSAFVFGAIHFIPPQAINAFVIAIVMGYIYLVTRSLVPVIIIHAINNGLAYMTLELTDTQATDIRTMITDDTIYWAVYAVSAAILAVSLVVMHRRARTKSREITLETKTTNE